MSFTEPGSARVTDPLEALGPAVFLMILEQLPFDGLAIAETVSKSWRACVREHERSIWRNQLLKLDVSDTDVTDLRSQEAAYDRQEPAAGTTHPSAVDWRAECRRRVLLNRNWQRGRCRNTWFRLSGLRVWRFKIDHEEGTMLCTTRSCKLEVIDMRAATTLFTMQIESGYAHLEFERGFIVFDEHDNTTGTVNLRVFQTPSCRARLSDKLHPSLPMRDRNRITKPRPDCAPRDPRGQLTHLRVIPMPEGCCAYRLHVDKADTPDERVMLLASGNDGLHLWDLINPAWHQHIPCDGSSLGYLELDDEYIFAATELNTLIFSRTRNTELTAFPPELGVKATSPDVAREYICQGFELDIDKLEETLVLPAGRESSDEHAESGDEDAGSSDEDAGSSDEDAESMDEDVWDEYSPRDHQVIPPYDLDRVHDLKLRPKLPEVIEDYAARFDRYEPFVSLRLQMIPRPGNGQKVSAVHYTDKHLVCTHEMGYISILRAYREVLAIIDDEEREARMAENTTIIVLHERITGLAIHGDYIAVTGYSLYWFRASDIPAWQPNERGELPDDACRPLRIFRAQSLPVEVTYVDPPSCLQIDDKGIYLAYNARDFPDTIERAFMDEDRHPRWDRVPQPPPRPARTGGGVVRMWNFISP